MKVLELTQVERTLLNNFLSFRGYSTTSVEEGKAIVFFKDTKFESSTKP